MKQKCLRARFCLFLFLGKATCNARHTRKRERDRVSERCRMGGGGGCIFRLMAKMEWRERKKEREQTWLITIIRRNQEKHFGAKQENKNKATGKVWETTSKEYFRKYFCFLDKAKQGSFQVKVEIGNYLISYLGKEKNTIFCNYTNVALV